MSKEIFTVVKEITDSFLKEKNYVRPLHVSIAGQVIKFIAEQVGNLALNKDKQKKLIARIFQYLTAGSQNSTHASGKRDGAQKSLNRGAARDTRRHHPRKK
jgi:hypothetical protein